VADSSDDLFGTKRTRTVFEGPKSKDKSKKKKKGSNNEEDLAVNKLANDTEDSARSSIGLGMLRTIANNKVARIDSVTFGRFTPGVVAYGYVLQLSDLSAVVSLPGGVTGTVALSEISDVCHSLVGPMKKEAAMPLIADMLSVNQPICCIVLGQTERSVGSAKKSLVLSMRASLLHRSVTLQHLMPGFPVLGCVASKEDHGYLISAGMNGVTFFLPYKAVPDSIGGKHMSVGKPVDCIVDSVNETAKTVNLRAHIKAVSEATTKGSQLSFLALRAGMLIHAVVEKVVQNGLIVNFLGLFHGVIDTNSLPRPVSSPSELPLLAKGTVHLARIVFINHSTKSVRLSLRPHVVDMRAPRGLPDRGALVTGLNVISTDKKVGILLSTRAAAGAEEDDEEDGGNLSDTDESGRPLSKKDKAEQLAKVRAKHESVLGVFVHRSSLAAVPEGGAEASGSKNGRDTVIASEKVDRVYRGLSDVQVRVIGYHLVEGWAVASNLKSYMHSEVVHSSQLAAGQVVDCEVAALRDFGLVVLVGGKVRAVCPAMHLTEVGILGGPSASTAKSIAKKFKVGQKVRMRVWECSGDGFVLTNKKSLVDDASGLVIASYADATEGSIAKGVISSVSADGLRVHFYNKVVGTVPMSVLVQQGVLDAEGAYRQGQIVSCIILGKTIPKEYKGKGPGKAKPRLTLGLDIGDASATIASLRESLNITPAAAEGTVTAPAAAPDGDGAYEIVSGLVVRQDEEALYVQLSSDKRVTATLMKIHVVDSAAVGASLVANGVFAVGSAVEEALVLSSSVAKNGVKTVQLSMKPLLLQVARAHNAQLSSASGTDAKGKKISAQLTANSEAVSGADVSIPSKASELSPGQIIAGTIWKVESYGVLIKFRDNLTALVPRTNLADRFMPTPVGSFEVGDAVRCAVQRVDYARDRVIATFKSAFVPQTSGQQSYLLSRLEEDYALASSAALAAAGASAEGEGEAGSGGNQVAAGIPDWRAAPLGSVVTASVVSVRSYGLVLQLAGGGKGGSGNTMMLARGVDEDEQYVRDQTLQCVVLDIDLKNRVFDVTIDREVVQQVTEANGGGKKGAKKAKPAAALAVGQFVSGTVMLLKDSYLGVMTAGGVVGYAQVADYHCPKRSSSDYSLGQQVTVRVEQTNTIVSRGSSDLDSIANPFVLCAIFTLQSSYDATSTLNTGASVLASRVQHEAEQADEALQSKLSLQGEPASGKQKFMDSLRLGAIMRWEVVKVSPLELQVAPDGLDTLGGLSVKASVHVSGAVTVDIGNNSDGLEASIEEISAAAAGGSKKNPKKALLAQQAAVASATAARHPFHSIQAGDKVTCRVTQVRREETTAEDGSTSQQVLVYLSLKSTDANANEAASVGAKDTGSRRMVQWRGKDGVKAGIVYPTAVVSVEPSGVVLALSPYVSTRVSYMDISADLDFVHKFKQCVGVGMPVLVCVTKVHSESAKGGGAKTSIDANRLLVEQFVAEGGDLAPHTHGAQNIKELPTYSGSGSGAELKAGQVVQGILSMHPNRIRAPPAFAVHLPHNRTVRVCVTEFCDPAHWADLQAVCAQQKRQADGSAPAASAAEAADGTIVSVRVLSVDGSSVEGSMRESRVSAKKKSAALAACEVPSVGELVTGYVAQTTGKGCFLRLSSDLTAQIQVKNLSDDFITNPAQMFRCGKLVKNAKVMEVLGGDGGSGKSGVHVHLSLKSTDTGQVPEGEAVELARLSKGMLTSGKIQSIAACGVFVALDNSTLVGLSRPMVAVSGGANADLAKLSSTFEVGEPVRVLVLGVSGRKISLGLKPSLFGEAVLTDDEESDDDDDEEEEDDDEEEEDSELGSDMDVDEDDEEEEGEDEEGSDADSEEEDDEEEEEGDMWAPVDSGDEEEDELDALVRAAAMHASDSEPESEAEAEEAVGKKRGRTEEGKGKKEPKGKAIKASARSAPASRDSDSEDEGHPQTRKASSVFGGSGGGGAAPDALMWDDFKPTGAPSAAAAAAESDSSDEDSEGEEEGSGNKQSARQKVHAKRAAEEKLRAREQSLSKGSAEPATAEAFERQLLAEPNSSYYWVRYMAMHLMAADIEAARRVAGRALRTINFREEEEKYNVWVALINLEHKYGTMSSLDEVFKRAGSESKGKYIHLHLASLYEAASDAAGAEAVFQLALKRPAFKKSKKVWMAYHDLTLRAGDADAAKKLLQRSLQSLSKHKHTAVLLHYCQSEFDFGSPDRARVLYEELLSTYPKRTDIWHVYVDREVNNVIY
jgi:ribosomal protein S1